MCKLIKMWHFNLRENNTIHITSFPRGKSTSFFKGGGLLCSHLSWGGGGDCSCATQYHTKLIHYFSLRQSNRKNGPDLIFFFMTQNQDLTTSDTADITSNTAYDVMINHHHNTMKLITYHIHFLNITGIYCSMYA